MTSYADHLRPFLPYVPPALVDGRCLAEVLAATAGLPGDLGAGPFMLECGLGDERTADVSVGALAGLGGPAALAEARPADDGWSGIRRFARRWSDPASVLGSVVRQVWLEFDVGLTRPRAAGTPSVFFDVAGGADPAGVAGCGLDALGVPAPGVVLDRVREHPGVLFVGAMPARRTDAVRVVGAAPGAAGVCDERLLEEVRPLVEEVWLAVDVGPSGLLPRRGLDLHVLPGAGSALLDVLVGHGLCTAAKRDAVLAAGVAAPEFGDVARPETVRGLATLLGPGGVDRLRLSLSHVKVVGGPGVAPSAKAYLCGFPGQRDGAA